MSAMMLTLLPTFFDKLNANIKTVDVIRAPFIVMVSAPRYNDNFVHCMRQCVQLLDSQSDFIKPLNWIRFQVKLSGDQIK